MLGGMADVTHILSAIDAGDPKAAAELLPLVYDELRKLAAARMAAEAPDHTLQATALVHEAYLRLVGSDQAQSWNSRGHFFAAAAEAMRRILVDAARRKQSLKQGGDRQRVELADVEPAAGAPDFDLIALDEALDRLARTDPRKAELVKLRFFAGLTNEQAADALGVSTSTADNDWAYAKSWLRVALDGRPVDPSC
jgi:RNA polymerase sigma factor (TIGR02999 family)